MLVSELGTRITNRGGKGMTALIRAEFIGRKVIYTFDLQPAGKMQYNGFI